MPPYTTLYDANIWSWRTCVAHISHRCLEEPCLIGAMLAWMAINIALTIAANISVFIEPIAQGSGIPEVGSWLAMPCTRWSRKHGEE